MEGAHRPEELAEQEPRSYAGWRRNLILGRGHNNLGFAYFMQGHYRMALQEYRAALPYFRASDLLEETANTNNNMGRVYAALYRRSHAESLIEDSLELRRQLGRDYRTALSLITAPMLIWRSVSHTGRVRWPKRHWASAKVYRRPGAWRRPAWF